MKNRILNLFPALMLLLFLTGCACEHEWIAADCVNAQVCTKCAEIGEPALGHDWTASTCTAPETVPAVLQLKVRLWATTGVMPPAPHRRPAPDAPKYRVKLLPTAMAIGHLEMSL